MEYSTLYIHISVITIAINKADDLWRLKRLVQRMNHNNAQNLICNNYIHLLKVSYANISNANNLIYTINILKESKYHDSITVIEYVEFASETIRLLVVCLSICFVNLTHGLHHPPVYLLRDIFTNTLNI